MKYQWCRVQWFVGEIGSCQVQRSKKEFALSGSEQNPDFTSAKWKEVIRQRVLSGARATGPVEAFKEHGADFIVADTLDDLVRQMNALTGEGLIDHDHLHAQIAARDHDDVAGFEDARDRLRLDRFGALDLGADSAVTAGFSQ